MIIWLLMQIIKQLNAVKATEISDELHRMSFSICLQASIDSSDASSSLDLIT